MGNPMRHSMHRGFLTLVALVSVAMVSPLPAAQANHPANPLQPGDVVTIAGAGCTVNFVYDGIGSQAGKVFIGVAAHCGEPGNIASSTQYPNFGTVVYDDDALNDFALIQVTTAGAPHVSGAGRGRPGLPTGVLQVGGAGAGDVLLYSGHGMVFGSSTATQERRVGVLTSFTTSIYCSVSPTIFGDSGGPVMHQETGKAVGIVSGIVSGPCLDTGPTVQAGINRAAIDGFPIGLRLG